MNRNPNITAIIPMIRIMFPPVLLIPSLMFHPMNAAEIPKKSKLKPTIIETNPDENIGNNMKIKPKITDIIPALLLMSIFSPPFNKLILYMIN